MKKLLLTMIALLSMTIAVAQQTSHTVQRGETLESIARKYNVTTAAIKKANPNAADMIYVGMKLIIPSSQQSKNNGTIQNNPRKTSSTTKNVPRREIQYSNQKNPQPPKNANNELNFGILADVFGGYSNFMWDGGSPVSGIGFGAGVTGQLYFNERNYAPEGYFAQIGINYARKGSGAYPINYVNAKVLPLGYSFCDLIDDCALFVKAGGYVALPFSKIETQKSSYSTNLDYGAIASIGISYDKFSVAVSYEHGFANVSNANVSLKNQSIFLILSYRLY